jgi:hypothetical protein
MKKTTDDIIALVRNPVRIVRAKIDVVVSVVQGLCGRASRVRTLLDDKEVRLVGVSRLRPGLHRSGTSPICQAALGHRRCSAQANLSNGTATNRSRAEGQSVSSRRLGKR